MATLPTQVRSGDIISADLMNAVLDELARLRGGSIGGGSQVVPNLFGTFLADARTRITKPSQQLTLGFTFDVNGAAVDPLVPANHNLIVLNQSPVADARVAPATPLTLVVSAAVSGSTSPGQNPPTITRIETPSGTPITSVAVNASMVIVGSNFSVSAAQNTVRFDTVNGTAIPDAADPTHRLLVTVPTGIPNAPVLSTDPPRPGIVITVGKTGNATPATITITVNPPLAAQPTIGNVSPGTQFETQDITITGTNFVAGTQVFIADTAAAIVSTTNTQIVATVPNIASIQPGGAPVPVSLRVRLPGAGGAEATFTGFRVRGV